MTSPASDMLPLVAGAPDETLAWHAGERITVGRFLADLRLVAERLPAGRHVLNVCTDRYHFTVGLAACLVAGKVSLLPSTHTPETVRQLLEFAPDAFCLTDAQACDIALPRFALPALGAAGFETVVPRLSADQLVACVFTSGSTGTPVPHPKRWGALVRNVTAGADRLGLGPGAPFTIVATVPPQHMYGFESTVLLALLGGGAFWAGRPFYPADIAAALDAAPRSRVLVTTPFHLRTLLAAGLPLPATDLIVSATAPLSGNLAVEAEARLQGRLKEIYGCTETGQIASRRTALSAEWQLFRDVTVSVEDGRAWASGGHVEQRTPLGDIIEVTEADRFLLHGRSADLVNIAGKRSSIGYLNHQLNAIPGVIDGSFFTSEGDQPDGVARLSAVVVAPGLDHAGLMRSLRARIDPLFLPRPLLFTDALPRNATGKLTRAAIDALRRRPAAGRE